MPGKKKADQVPQNKILTQISESDSTRGYGHYALGNTENEVGLIKYSKSQSLFERLQVIQPFLYFMRKHMYNYILFEW